MYKKRLTGITHPWQKRYFRLTDGENEVFYFKSPSSADGTERGSIDLLTASRLCPTDESVKNPKDPAVKRHGQHSLDVHTTEPRVYHLIFESALDREAWARALYRAADPALCKVHPSLQGVCGVAAKSGGGGGGAATPSRAAAGEPAGARPLQSPNNPFNLSVDGGGGGGGGGGDGSFGGGGGGGGGASASAEDAAEGGGGGGFLNLFSRKEKEAAPEAVELQPMTGSREGSPAQQGGGRGRGGARGGGPGRGRGGRGGGGPRGRGRGGAQRGRGRGGGGSALAGAKSQPLLDSDEGSSDDDDSDSDSGSDDDDSGSEGGEGKRSCCAVA